MCSSASSTTHEMLECDRARFNMCSSASRARRSMCSSASRAPLNLCARAHRERDSTNARAHRERDSTHVLECIEYDSTYARAHRAPWYFHEKRLRSPPVSNIKKYIETKTMGSEALTQAQNRGYIEHMIKRPARAIKRLAIGAYPRPRAVLLF